MPVRLDAVEAITVVTVDTVLGALVLVDHVQSLVQHLRRESCCRGRDAPVWLQLPPGGGGPGCGLWLREGRVLPVKGRLKEAQKGQGGGGGWV